MNTPWATSILLGIVLYPGLLYALGPHEILLLVNESSQASMEIANHYIHQRNIPSRNVVYLALPDSARYPKSSTTPKRFRSEIRAPAMRAVQERGLQHHILAWVYSSDFPVRVGMSPPISLMGITFLKGRRPPGPAVKNGTLASRLFAGPIKRGGPFAPSQTLEWLGAALKTNMPLPSMMLGFTGSRGNSVEEILKALDRGMASEASSPSCTVLFLTNENVRSTCRHWQFAEAQQELVRSGVTARILKGPPPPKQVDSILGVMTGARSVKPFQYRRLAPGSMTENLTSAAAIFDRNIEQTKITRWISAGATVTAGTVHEPFAIWTKFPSARFFSHYANGCTALESFYLSIASPFQQLLLGDPLARPWGRKPNSKVLVTWANEEQTALSVKVMVPETAKPARFMHFLDDVLMEEHLNRKSFTLNVSKLNDGYHELRSVTYSGQPVSHQSFQLYPFTVDKRGRKVTLTGTQSQDQHDLHHKLTLTVQATGTPDELRIVSNERVLDVLAGASSNTFVVKPALLGAGPVQLQGAAKYADGREVRSAPLAITIERLNQPPKLESIEILEEEDVRRVKPVLTDPDGDPARADWFRLAVQDSRRRRLDENFAGVQGRIRKEKNRLLFEPSGDQSLHTLLFRKGTEPLEEVTAEVSISPGKPVVLKDQWAGLVFGYRDEDNYGFFGIDGSASAWTIRYRVNGKFKRTLALGAPIQTDPWYTLSVEVRPGRTVLGYVDGVLACSNRAPVNVRKGSAGLLSGKNNLYFRKAAVRGSEKGYRAEGNDLVIPNKSAIPTLAWMIRVKDRSASTTHLVDLKELFK